MSMVFLADFFFFCMSSAGTAHALCSDQHQGGRLFGYVGAGATWEREQCVCERASRSQARLFDDILHIPAHREAGQTCPYQ